MSFINETEMTPRKICCATQNFGVLFFISVGQRVSFRVGMTRDRMNLAWDWDEGGTPSLRLE